MTPATVISAPVTIIGAPATVTGCPEAVSTEEAHKTGTPAAAT